VQFLVEISGVKARTSAIRFPLPASEQTTVLTLTERNDI